MVNDSLSQKPILQAQQISYINAIAVSQDPTVDDLIQAMSSMTTEETDLIQIMTIGQKRILYGWMPGNGALLLVTLGECATVTSEYCTRPAITHQNFAG